MFLIAICAGLLGLLFIQRPCTIRSTSTPRVASTHTSLTSYPSLKSPTRADPGLLEPYDFTSSRSRGFAFDSSPHGYYNQVGAFWTYFTGFWPWRPSDLHLDTSLQNGGHPTSICTSLQNGGCSISLDPVDWSAPKLHQVGNFRKYFTGFT